MRKQEPPFPSFVTMSRELQKDTLRLPNYRESIILRFHPYPQSQRKTVDPMMKTVDYRYAAEPATLEGKADSCVSSDDDGANADKAVLDLDRAVNIEDGTQVRRRRSLTSLIIDLALAMKVKKRRSSLKFRSDT